MLENMKIFNNTEVNFTRVTYKNNIFLYYNSYSLYN